MYFSFQGKTTLITGASMGLGEEFARQLARAGSHLILVARSKDKLEKIAHECETEYGIQAHVFICDLAWPEAPRKLYEDLQREKLHVDLLINNAGFGYCGPFEQALTEKDQEMIQVNIGALVTLTHLFLPAMLEKGSGGILNVASTAAFQPLPKLSLYAATKACVLSFTEALWAEYQQRGIRVFCLCPGNTKSHFHETAGVPPKYIFLQAPADRVIARALRLFSQTNRPSAIDGWLNFVLAVTSRFFPRAWVVQVTNLIYR